MEKKLVGFSVQNDIIKKFNHTVQRLVKLENF